MLDIRERGGVESAQGCYIAGTIQLQVPSVGQGAGDVQYVVAADAHLVRVQVPRVAGGAIDLERTTILHVHNPGIGHAAYGRHGAGSVEEHVRVELVGQGADVGLIAGSFELDQPGVGQRAGNGQFVVAASAAKVSVEVPAVVHIARDREYRRVLQIHRSGIGIGQVASDRQG